MTSHISKAVSPTIAEQSIIYDFDIKVSRGSSESRRRTLLVNSMHVTVENAEDNLLIMLIDRALDYRRHLRCRLLTMLKCGSDQ